MCARWPVGQHVVVGRQQRHKQVRGARGKAHFRSMQCLLHAQSSSDYGCYGCYGCYGAPADSLLVLPAVPLACAVLPPPPPPPTLELPAAHPAKPARSSS